MSAVAKKNAHLKTASHGLVIPAGENGTPCPEATVDTPAAATKTAPIDGRLRGTFGVEIVEESEVQLKDLRLSSTPQISFGDPRVVSALTGADGCHTTRRNEILLELPFDLRLNGNIEIDLEAFTRVIARARKANVEESTFSGPATTPASPAPVPPL
jgi:hypothetical protein